MNTAEENILLHRIVRDLHYMARRYADGRSTYATRVFNQHTRDLLELGVDLNPTGDGTVWARDGMGRVYDGLTAAEAAQGRPIDEFRQTADMEDYTRLRAALGIIRDSYGQVCEEFEICRHTACWSSHGAWMMADMALKGGDGMSARYDRALKAIGHIPHEQCMVSALHVGYELQEAERRIDLLESTLRRVVPGIGLKQCAVHGHEECRDCGEFWPRDVAQSECMVCIVRAALDEAVQHDA